MTDEHKAKISVANKGKKRSIETCVKISIVQMGHIDSPETRAKKSASRMGYKPSPEAIAKTVAANIGRIQSPEACAKISAARTGKIGPFAPHWKGGITPANVIIRNSVEYVIWRTAVFERDHYTCQECGQIGGSLEAHHIHEFSNYPDERLVVDNGKTLCLKCHNKTKFGRRHNAPEV